MTKQDCLKLAKLIHRENSLLKKLRKEKYLNEEYVNGLITGVNRLSKKIANIIRKDNEKFMTRINNYIGEL